MSDEPITGAAAKGPIAWMAQNGVASNLLMAVIMLAGVLGLLQVKQEVFPTFELDFVSVRVVWSGASAEDVEDAIVNPLERELRLVNDLRRCKRTFVVDWDHNATRLL